MNDQEQKKTNKLFNGVLSKFTSLGKKTADSIQQKTQDISAKRKKNAIEQKMQKYNPLFEENFKSADFNIPNIIEIVDDAVRRDVEVCKGAIGWIDKVNGVEILHLYDEWVTESKIQFIPFPQCDAVYYVDNFDRTTFVNVESVFERTTNEKLSELPSDEVDERLNFYSEIISDRIEDGMPEEEAVAKMGTVDEVAEQIIGDIPLSSILKKKIKSRN